MIVKRLKFKKLQKSLKLASNFAIILYTIVFNKQEE